MPTAKTPRTPRGEEEDRFGYDLSGIDGRVRMSGCLQPPNLLGDLGVLAVHLRGLGTLAVLLGDLGVLAVLLGVLGVLAVLLGVLGVLAVHLRGLGALAVRLRGLGALAVRLRGLGALAVRLRGLGALAVRLGRGPWQLLNTAPMTTQLRKDQPLASSAGSSYPLRRGRLICAFASGSSTNCSFTGSQVILRPSSRQMFIRMQIMVE